MVIFATSQIRAIFLPIRCFLNQFFSHETTLIWFLLICVFSSQAFILQLCPRDTKGGGGSDNQVVSGLSYLFFFVFVSFLAGVHDKRSCIFLSIHTSYRRFRIEVT